MIKAHVIRPDYGKSDGSAKLTATLTKGSVTKKMTFIATVKEQGMTNTQCVTADKNWISIYNYGSIMSNIQLPSVGPNYSSITWKSSDITVVSADGIVNRPDNGLDKASVTLTATITKGSITDTKDIVLTICPWSDEEEVNLAVNAITWDTIRGNNTVETEITFDLNLVKNGVRSTDIVWSPTIPSIIAADGKINRPAYKDGDCTLSIPAVISKGKASQQIQKFLGLEVLKLQISNNEAVTKAMTIVDATMVKGSNVDLNDMINNVVLPTVLNQVTYSDLKSITLKWSLIKAQNDQTVDTTNQFAKIVTDNNGVSTLQIIRPKVGQLNGSAFLQVSITSVIAQGNTYTAYNVFPLGIIAYTS